MLHSIANKWWLLLLNGIFTILFGFMAFAWPGLTLWTLVILYAGYCFAEGVTAIAASFGHRDEKGKSWWQMLLMGVVSLAAGFTAFAWPVITTVVLLIIIAIWAIAHGIFEIVAAISLRKVIKNEWLLALAGVVSIIFGLAMIAKPAEGAMALIWLIGTLALFRGFLLMTLAFKLRRFSRGHWPTATPLPIT